MGDVVSVARSEDGRIAELYIIRDSMESDIESVYKRESHTIVKTPIGEYKAQPKDQLISQLSSRGYGQIYLDINDCIAGFVPINDKAEGYAFVIEGKIFKEASDDEFVKIKYFGMNGEIDSIIHDYNYTKVDNIKLTSYSSLPDVLNKVPQLIRLSKEGKWLNIDTVTNSKSESSLSLNLMVEQGTPIAYLSATYNLGGRAILNEGTKVMKIPRTTIETEDGKETVIDVDNEAGFQVGDVKELLANTEKYSFTAYNSDQESYTPDLILMYRSSSISLGSPMLLVSKVIQTLDKDNETKTAVIGYYENEERTIIDSDKKVLESLQLKTGDVVKYANDTRGYVSAACKIFDGKTYKFTTPPEYNASDYGNSFQIRSNYAYRLDGANLYLSDSTMYNEKLSKMDVVPLGSAAVYRVSSNKKVSKISLNEVKTFKSTGNAEYAFAMLRYGIGRILVVYEN